MDRFYRGFVAGVVGGLAMNVWSLFSYYILNFSERRFLDWASMIIYGSLPTSTFQIVYAQIIQLLWVGLLGIIFALLIPAITSRFYLGKGVIYGLMSGFIIYAITTLFRIPNLVIFSTTTVLSNHIGGIIWGLTMAYVLRRLDTTPLRN
ncbi:MAG: hypothetical protein VR67_00600 [Peptococcaceae bacterium BRH_c8a]|nr:MAG: hypothetical protein VR67_00600 [Peptococcaceae bacterium BRH_c8a]